MDVVLSLLILTSVCHGVEAVRCLECRHVSKPSHCHTVVQCPEGTVCGIERFAHHNGLVSYDVGCKPQSCPGLHSEPHLPTKATRSSSPDCSECCNTDLCNVKGCGFQGFPTPRGPICYTCINTQFCEDVIGCNLDEECYMMGRYEYGDMVVTSGCRSSNICSEKHSGQATNLIGRKRRHVSVRQTNQNLLFCDTCCSDDLCNNGCNPNINVCIHIDPPSHGNIQFSDNAMTSGTVAKFSCDAGYDLFGPPTTTCTNGKWGFQSHPVCRLRLCSQVDTPLHGYLSYSANSLTSGTVAMFKCHNGYDLSGPQTTTCTNGTWDFQSHPVCKLRGCSKLDAPSHGYVNYSINGVTGTVAAFGCVPGYDFLGPPSANCTNGTWTIQSLPFLHFHYQCVIRGCGKLSPVTNVSISYTNNGTVFGSTVTFDCESGFMLNGSASSTCQADGLWDVQTCPVCQEVRSCFYIHQLNNNSSSGVYSIRLNDEDRQVTKKVYCDMETDGGGWTVVQRRLDGSVNFSRNFTEYVNGFGNINGEYWLGLKWMRILSNAEPQNLRVDLVAGDNTAAFATYSSFNLDSDSRNTLRLGSYSGNSSVLYGMTYNNGSAFATYDNDIDDCGHSAAAGWWYRQCTFANINGVYDVPGKECSFSRKERCLTWRSYTGNEALKGTSMKLRNI